MNNSKTFDQKYAEDLAKIKHINLADKARILGGRYEEDALYFDFFDRRLKVTKNGISDMKGSDPTAAVKLLLCRYILSCPEKLPEKSDKLVTFREFKDSGPLFSSFTTNTNRIIETSFSGHLKGLEIRCTKLGGIIMEMANYDLCVRFKALHRIPVILNFNDNEGGMPSKATYLYQEDAEKYLDLECLSITCTYLTGQLIH